MLVATAVPSYVKSVETFCMKLRWPCLLSTCVSPHPGYDPAFEEAIFTRVGCIKQVLVVKELSNARMSGASMQVFRSAPRLVVRVSLSLFHCQHIFGPREDMYEDVFTNNLIPQVLDAAQLIEQLTSGLSKEDYYVSESAVVKLEFLWMVQTGLWPLLLQ